MDIFGNDGYLSIIVSTFALLGSMYSFYMTVLKKAKIETHVGNVIRFQSHKSKLGFSENFNIPLTAVNSGARAATILSFTLEVKNPRINQIKSYYTCAVGSFQDDINGIAHPYSPVVVAGRQSKTLQLIFDRIPGQEDTPQQAEQDIRHVEVEGGTFEFTLILEIATAGKIKITRTKFAMNIEKLDYRRFHNGGSMPMYNVKFNAVYGG